jgi:hypothetical protein
MTNLVDEVTTHIDNILVNFIAVLNNEFPKLRDADLGMMFRKCHGTGENNRLHIQDVMIDNLVSDNFGSNASEHTIDHKMM